MFQCSCCLCGVSCGGSSSEVGLGHAVPPFLLDPEVPAPGGSNSDSKTVEKVEITQQLHQGCHPNPLTRGPETPTWTRPEEAASAQTAGPPMQLRWCTSADKRKTSRLNPMGNKPVRRSRPLEAVRSRTDFSCLGGPAVGADAASTGRVHVGVSGPLVRGFEWQP